MATWRRALAIGLAVSFGVPALLCGLCGLGGLAIDGSIALEAEGEVSSPPAAVFDLLDDAEGIARWWGAAMVEAAPEGAPPMSVAAQPGAPDAGVGARVDFTAGGVVTETWTILALEPPGRVVYDVDFKILRVVRTITLTPTGGGTHVRWVETGEIGNPWLRWTTLGGHGEVVANFHRAIRALDGS